jgi:hypothetical protein
MAIWELPGGHGPSAPARRWLIPAGVLVVLAVLALTVVLGAVRAEGSSVRSRSPATCRAHTPSQAPHNPWKATRQRLVPRGATAIRLCRYSGLNADPPLRRTSQRVLRNRRLIARLTNEFDRLPVLHGPVACPVDDASAIVLHLVYRHRHSERVTVGLSGCALVTNGHLSRTAMRPPAGPKLLRQLEALS